MLLNQSTQGGEFEIIRTPPWAPTWTESQAFLAEHRASLLANPVVELLAGADDATARQHHAILALTTGYPHTPVYAMITDPAHAEDAAMDAIETGDISMLALIMTVAPNLAARPVSWGVAAAVLLLAQGNPDQATPMQRRAHAVRLRSLAARQPGLSGVADIVGILAAPDARE